MQHACVSPPPFGCHKRHNVAYGCSLGATVCLSACLSVCVRVSLSLRGCIYLPHFTAQDCKVEGAGQGGKGEAEKAKGKVEKGETAWDTPDAAALIGGLVCGTISKFPRETRALARVLS